MKTQLITALILATAGTVLAQQPGQEESRGHNSMNTPVRARQRVEAEVDVPQFQRPALRSVEEVLPATSAPRGLQARQGVRREGPLLPPTEGAPESRPGRRGSSSPQGPGRVRGERPQLPVAEAPAFAPRRAAAEDEAVKAPEAPVRARQGGRGSAAPQRQEMRWRERPQRDAAYSVDESEYESEADRVARASGRHGR